ncbi:MBL fold metallo-hydrolase [Amycolatopsis alkalitolerans]|uniref:MBL fold metallo-hydrolase n=1 Tax=Amycolatopsis alkalitolerans TaxID=2547244 RepID=A0A5C4LYH0_9PSEU|nr:MBL fold metallo-hydrolase [Amycolatopsis alkalitolerans]TNC24153.1 MBL fold metallo-hydrolase [Amycolatopsis alkalitolerans]
MRLTVLGCRSGMPADGQASSGYLVETASAQILLDCGPGIATALSAVTDATLLDAIVVSHLHADHCYDLLPIGKSLLSATMTYPGGPAARVDEMRAVPLLVPAGARELFTRWAALFPVTTIPLLDKAFERAFDVREYEPGEVFEIGDATIGVHELRHVLPNCGIRVEAGGAALAYTGDTGTTDAAVKLAADADLLLAEATLSHPDRTEHGHLCGGDAGRIAARAGVRELALTHFSCTERHWLRHLRDEAASEFDGPVRMVRAGERLTVGNG